VGATHTNTPEDKGWKPKEGPFVQNSVIGKLLKGGEPIGFHEETNISSTSNKVQTPKTSDKEKMMEEEVNGRQGSITFKFPIQDPKVMGKMKNTPLFILPNFHGISREEPNTFIFKFDVLCCSYDYSMDAQKLKLFPTTLKVSTLYWFMGLVRNSIRT